MDGPKPPPKGSPVETAENSMDLIKYEKRDIRGDVMNFALMTFLYFIQGAVTGLIMAVPFILQKRKVSYQQQVNSRINYTYLILLYSRVCDGDLRYDRAWWGVIRSDT